MSNVPKTETKEENKKKEKKFDESQIKKEGLELMKTREDQEIDDQTLTQKKKKQDHMVSMNTANADLLGFFISFVLNINFFL